MAKIDLLEVESLQIYVPNPTETKKGAKLKVLGKDYKCLNVEMIMTIGPGKELEYEGEIISVTEIEMVDETVYFVPGHYRSLLDRLSHRRV